MKKVDLIFIIILIILLAFAIYTSVNEGGKCYANPSQYFVDKVAKAYNTTVNCLCSTGIPTKPIVIFGYHRKNETKL